LAPRSVRRWWNSSIFMARACYHRARFGGKVSISITRRRAMQNGLAFAQPLAAPHTAPIKPDPAKVER
jgi:hypothetical protein